MEKEARIRPLLGYQSIIELKARAENKGLHTLDFIQAASEFWIGNSSSGDQYRLRRYGKGWVIQVQESFLNKTTGHFVFKDDIPSFNYLTYADHHETEYKFATKEAALECFIKNDHRVI